VSCALIICLAATTTAMTAEHIVLLHGLGRTHRSMRTLEVHLTQKGFHVTNIDYPSRSHRIEELASIIGDRIQRSGLDAQARLHFVTHSLGGILVRWLHVRGRLPRIGRVVMLSPPNQGSEIADKLGRWRIVRKALGPSIHQLGTDPASVPNMLGAVDFELGVITGNKSLNPLFSRWVPGRDDGKVSTKRAAVAGMKDFLELPHSHGFIMHKPEVLKQVVHFLHTGRFFRDPKP